MVVPANIYDSLISGSASDYLQVDVAQMGGAALSTASAQVGVNVIQAAGTAWGSGAITAASIASDAITAAKIADGAIDAGALAADCITSAKIADDAIATEHIATGAISSDSFAAGAITAAVIATGAIDADAIADNAIDAGAIAADAITAAKIADGAIDAATFAAGAINAAAIADAAIDAATFAAGAINAAAIADGAIDAATFAADVDAEAATWIWNAETASYGGAGTYGQAVEDTLADTNELQTDDTPTTLAAMDAKLDTIDDFLDTEVAAILEDTGTTIPGILGSPAGADLATDIAAIKSDTGDILTDTAEIGAAGAGLTAVPWNAAWDAEVQSEVFDALDAAFTDATGLTANGLLDRIRTIGWIMRNKIEVTDANGNTTIYKDDNSTSAFTVAGMLTDDSTTTTRLRAA